MKEYLPWTTTGLRFSDLQGVDGWLTRKEAMLLYRLAKTYAHKGSIVEIGSWKGRSTICLAQGSLAGGGSPVHAIDPHTGSSEHGSVWTFNTFKTNIERAGIAHSVLPHVQTSAAAAKQWPGDKVSLLWIDGAHEYEHVLEDYVLWMPFLMEGGVIAFHDSLEDGPRRVIETFLYKNTLFRNIRFVHGITYAVKGRGSRWRNRAMLFVRDASYWGWFLQNRCRKLLKYMGVRRSERTG